MLEAQRTRSINSVKDLIGQDGAYGGMDLQGFYYYCIENFRYLFANIGFTI